MGHLLAFDGGTRETIAAAKSTKNCCDGLLALGFSNLVVSLSNHGKADAAVLRQAQDEAGVRG
jgi:hypothetical protein